MYVTQWDGRKMGIIKRTIMELCRKPFRSISLLLLFCVLCLMSMMGEIVIHSIEQYVDHVTVREGLGIKVKGEALINVKGNVFSMNEQILSELSNLNGVIGYNTRDSYEIECKPMNCRNIPYQETDNLAAVKNTEKITIIGNLNTNMWEGFRCGDLVLTQGEYPSMKNQGVVIDSIFAEQNNLQIGNSIEVLDDISLQKKELKITGIYQTIVPPKIENITTNGTYFMVSPSSYLFCDLVTFHKLSDLEDFDSSLLFFVDSYESIDKVYKEIQEKESSSQMEEITKTSEHGMAYTTDIIYSMKNIINKLLVFIYSVGLIILTLMTVLWMRDHSYETGIYIALGLQKYKIVLYYGIEIVIIVIVGGGLSILLSYVLLSKQGSNIIHYLLMENGILEEQILGGRNAFDYFSVGTVLITNVKWILCIGLSTLISSIIIVNYKPRSLFRVR